MDFNTLKEKCEYYRQIADYKLLPNSYVMIMLDGRSFSKKIKNKFDKPFDRDFGRMMDETTKYLCENIQGALLGYCQSDEIHIVVADHVRQDEGTNTSTSSFFGYRMCKVLSIAAALATSKFNQLMMDYRVANVESNSGCAGDTIDDCRQAIMNSPLYEFDCKAWNIPNTNDTFAWILYRQIDCIRNSKQQLAQTYLPHKQLVGKHTDEQIAMLKNEKNIDWYKDVAQGFKFGRFCHRVTVDMHSELFGDYTRKMWKTKPAYELTNTEAEHDFDIKEVIVGKIYHEDKDGKIV